MKEEEIIFFDGVCNLCNNSVNFIIDRDKNKVFDFAALQSNFTVEKLSSFDIDLEKLDTILLLKENKIYTKSSAALHIAKNLSGLWPLLFGFIILPKPLRDIFYNLIAKNRYSFFGKLEACRIPTPELKSRFLG